MSLAVAGTATNRTASLTAGRSWRSLMQSSAGAVDATYCRLLVQTRRRELTVKATTGHRLSGLSRTRRDGLFELLEGASADESRAIPISLELLPATERANWERLFSRRTRSGVLLPLRTRTGLCGWLIVGEERGSGRQPLTPERLHHLGEVASELERMLDATTMFERWQRRSRAADARAIEESMRRRLAHQVHDEVGQPLSTLLVRARMVLSAGTADREELTILEGMAERALEATRSLAREVRRGRRNEDDPLHEARAYAEEMLAGTTRLLWVDGRLGPGGPRRALREVAFVIKESINNIARHAHASRVEVRLVNARRGLRVSIADDGVGFAVDRPSAGLGLRANAERMQAVGGRFEVSSRSGLGTVVGLELPR